MRLLMVSGDRQVSIGERGPFHAMQREFSRFFERVDVICPRPPRAVSVRTIHDNVHLHPARCGRSGMVRYIARKGIELVRAERHSLIVSHDYGWFYNGLGSRRISRATGVPYVSELHHVPGHPVPADLRERFDKLVARCYVRWAKSKVLAFRVVNREQMPSLLRRWHVPEAKILVLPSLYLDRGIFHPPAAPLEPEQDLVFVGRMVNNKGLDRIVDALGLLAHRGIRLKTLLVGRGPLAADVRRRAERRGVAGDLRFVQWVDEQEDLAEIYRRSRVCVCASSSEGGPRFTVEAMACGTPVVSTHVGLMADLLGDERAGALARFDAQGLAEAIERVVSDEGRRLEMGRHAAELVAPFEYGRAVAAYANGLRRLVGEPEIAP